MRALQTHGLTEDKWIPPISRFWQLEKSDEQWARFFGLGRIQKTPLQLYDVRDESGELVGYSNYDPTSCDSYEIEFAIAEPNPVTFEIGRPTAITEQVGRVAVRIVRYAFENQLFRCWQCRLADAPDLVRVGFIRTLGEDKMREFEWSLRKKAYDRRLRQGF